MASSSHRGQAAAPSTVAKDVVYPCPTPCVPCTALEVCRWLGKRRGPRKGHIERTPFCTIMAVALTLHPVPSHATEPEIIPNPYTWGCLLGVEYRSPDGPLQRLVTLGRIQEAPLPIW